MNKCINVVLAKLQEMAYRDRLKEFGGAVKEKFNPTQPEQEALGAFRQRRLLALKEGKTSESFDKLFRAAYEGEEYKYEAGWALFEPLWEQILEIFFYDRREFNDQFKEFVRFCRKSGWRPEVHGSMRVLVKLAMYATLIKSPPPVVKRKGLVGEIMDGVGKALRLVGIQPDEVRAFVKEVVRAII